LGLVGDERVTPSHKEEHMELRNRNLRRSSGARLV